MYEELVALSDEVRLTFHSLTALAARLHTGVIDPPGRAVLEFLHRHGPTPVPDIARGRGVTRQHIQAVVNTLLERDLVTTRTNPAHRRSRLVALSPDGQTLIDVIDDRERQAVASLRSALDPDELTRATAVLADLRKRLDVIEGDPP